MRIEQQLRDQATESISLAAQAQDASDTDETDGVVPGTVHVTPSCDDTV